jgi:hypothetical protein
MTMLSRTSTSVAPSRRPAKSGCAVAMSCCFPAAGVGTRLPHGRDHEERIDDVHRGKQQGQCPES